MIEWFFYAVLLFSILISTLSGRKTLLYAIAFLMPMTQVLPAPLGIPSSAVNLMILGVLAARVMQDSWRQPTDRLPLKGPIVLMTAMLLLGLCIRGLGEMSGGIYMLPFTEVMRNIWYWVTPFLLFTLVYRSLGDPRPARTMVMACQLSITFECLISMVEAAQGSGRATAHLKEANLAGAYFAAGSAFFLTWFLLSRGKAKLLFGAAWLLASFALFNTLSRGGLLAAAVASTVAIGIYALGRRSSARAKLVLAAVLAIVVLNFSLFVPQKVMDRILFTFGGGRSQAVEQSSEYDQSAEERLIYWSMAWDFFKANPIGYGAFTFPQLLSSNWDVAKQTHNIYLQVLVEHGIQGFIALILLILAVYGRLRRSYVTSEGEYAQVLVVSLIAWWTAVVIAHLFVNPFFLLQTNGQFWLMLACVFTLERAKAVPPEEETIAAPRPRRSWEIPAGMGPGSPDRPGRYAGDPRHAPGSRR